MFYGQCSACNTSNISHSNSFSQRSFYCTYCDIIQVGVKSVVECFSFGQINFWPLPSELSKIKISADAFFHLVKSF